MGDWLERHQGAMQALREASWDLTFTVDGLRAAGIHRNLQDRLESITALIMAASANASGAVSDMLSEQIAGQREQMGIMLLAALDFTERVEDDRESD